MCMTSKTILEANAERMRDYYRRSVGSTLSNEFYYIVGFFGQSSRILDFGNRRPL